MQVASQKACTGLRPWLLALAFLIALDRGDAKAASSAGKVKTSSGSSAAGLMGGNWAGGARYEEANQNRSAGVTRLKYELLDGYDRTTPPAGAVVRVQFRYRSTADIQSSRWVELCSWLHSRVGFASSDRF